MPRLSSPPQTAEYILDAVPAAYVRLDRDFRYTFVNRAAEQQLGKSRDELLGKVLWEVFPNLTGTVFEKQFHKAMAERVEVTFEHLYEPCQIWYALSAFPDEDGGIVVHADDITSRKKAETGQRLSEYKFSVAFRGFPGAAAMTNLANGRFIEVNEGFLQLTGYRMEEVIGNTALGLNLWSDPEERKRLLVLLMQQGTVIGFESTLRKKSGELGHGLVSAAIVDVDGTSCLFTETLDITERKLAEAAQRKSEERLLLSMEATSDGIWDWNVPTDETYVSSSWYRMLGYEAGAFPQTGAAWAELIHPDDREFALRVNNDCIDGTVDTFQVEYRMKHYNGEWRWVFGRGKCVARDPKGRALRMVGTHVDITERKRAEQVQAFLAQAGSGVGEEPFFNILARYLAESLQMDFVCIDRLLGDGMVAQTVSVWYDGSFQDNLTYTLKDTPCGDVVAKRVCCFREGVRHKFPMDTVLQEMVAESYAGTTLLGIDGKPIGLIALIGRRRMDDTRLAESLLEMVSIRAARELERMQAEEALRESEAFLNETGRVAKVGGWKLNLLTNELKWTSEVYRIHEMEDGFVPTVERAIDFYAPESWTVISRAVERAIQYGEPFDLELEILTARKKRLWVQAIGSVHTEKDGTRILGGTFQDITERKQAELELRDSEERLRLIFESAPVAINISRGTDIIYANPSYLRMFGLQSLEDLKGVAPLEQFVPEWRSRILENIQRRRDGLAVPTEYETECLRRDGTRFEVFQKFSRTMFADGPATVAFIFDITERKQAEAAQEQLRLQLAQAQKMESIGRLAGGVAHDFNNLLTVINGYAALVLGRMNSTDPRFHNLSEIHRAGERAASLVRQLLAFSRRQVLQPEVLDLNATVTEMVNMLNRLVGEDVEVVVELCPAAGSIRADRHQIEQVIMNLAVNGRDAMPGGGTLSLEIAQRHLEVAHICRWTNEPISPGTYLELTVRDTGSGMDQHTLEHLFEPFYTTKGVGKGTGLGLSTVQGIVSQSGGHIEVESELGKGSAFHVLLPLAGLPVAENRVPHGTAAPRGAETILLVEDQVQVRDFFATILRDCGYQVVVAQDADEALRAFAAQPFDLLVTDVVMPKMSGVALARHLRIKVPGLRALFVSGYSQDTHENEWGALDSADFLQKPFAPSALLGKVREILDRP